MKRSLFVTAILFAVLVKLHAQLVVFEKSEPFEEPSFGWNKVLQLTNGNTFFFHSTKKDGIEVSVFDKKRKQIAIKSIEGKLWDSKKMQSSVIKAVFEIGGEPVIFIAQADDRKPTLYRIQLDPETGAVKNEVDMGNQPEMPGFKGRYMLYDNVDMSDLTIEKDPGSDCYAVIFMNNFAYDSSEGIRVVHYNGQHKKMSTSSYNAPGVTSGSVKYLTAVVDGDKRVFISAYNLNDNTGKGGTSSLTISRLDEGSSRFEHKVISFPANLRETKAQMLYHHHSNQLRLLTLNLIKTVKETKEKSISYYSIELSNIDPETLSLSDEHPISGKRIKGFGENHFENQDEYVGIPQFLTLNRDNTTTVLWEEIRQITYEYKGGSGGASNTYLGPIGVSVLNDTGAEKDGFLIRKKQRADSKFPKLYMPERNKGYFKNAPALISQWDNNAFLTFDYIDAPKNRYILYNELPENLNIDNQEDKLIAVANVSETSTICYRLENGKLNYFHLFDDPEDKSANTFCFVQSSDYRKDSNTYAVIIVEQNRHGKQARIAWVKFE